MVKLFSLFAAALDEAVQPIADLDLDGRVVAANRPFANLTGYPAGEGMD